jgi:hypothetical protein
MKAADYSTQTNAVAAFVATNSICQGQQVPILWPLILQTGHEIAFAHTSFKWANLASHKAGVTVAIVGISHHAGKIRRLFSITDDGATIEKQTTNINAYLAAGRDIIVNKESAPIASLPKMIFGNKVVDGGHLRMGPEDAALLGLSEAARSKIVRRIYGSLDFIRGEIVYCL